MNILDKFLVLLALAILSPLFCVVCALLKFTGEGKVFYLQKRLGKNRKTFFLYKFATMLENSPNMATGTVTVKDDPRVLPVGRFLRRTKINELPQIINVLRGDMNIIGPRPLTDETFGYYTKAAGNAILSVAPGLSGVGSIIFCDEESLLQGSNASSEFYKNKIAPYKEELEIWYVKNRNFFVNIVLITFTLLILIFPLRAAIFKIFPTLPQLPDFFKIHG